MAEASETEKAATKIQSDNLSQLVARILNQLALSSWLPSAFLVLTVAFILALGQAVMDDRHLAQAVPTAFSKLGSISFQSVILMFAAVVVLTMLTQAFAFEAIRLLEGYWGTGRLVLLIARLPLSYHKQRRRTLRRRLRRLKKASWPRVERKLRNLKPQLSDDMIMHMKAEVLPKSTARVQLCPADLERVRRYDWVDWLSNRTRREKESIEHKLLDYPLDNDVQVTKLGNILRRSESETGAANVETFVEENYDVVPFSLQVEHDEQRGRLDLYCSMVFMWVFLTVVAIAIFNGAHPRYSIGAAVIGIVGALLTYRAAVASARHYGSILIQIGAVVASLSKAESEPAPPSAPIPATASSAAPAST